MKTAISLPDDLFHSADELADSLGTTRSNLYATALAEFVAKHRHDGITAKLNEVYAELPSALDPEIVDSQSRTLASEKW